MPPAYLTCTPYDPAFESEGLPNKKPVILTDSLFGGATGTQTLDLFHAMEAL